jgi:histone deacetylase complex subunit SAP18
MSLQPTNDRKIDRATTSPFLLRLFWRMQRPLEAYEFSVAPPADTSNISDYSSLLPQSIRQQSVQIYTWPTCTLAELTGLLGTVLPPGILGEGPGGSVGTRLVYKLIFPDTRGGVSESGKGKWIDKPLGSVVIGGNASILQDEDETNGALKTENLEGDADKTLADARFVIGDYVACTIYPPAADGRVAPMPLGGARGPREPYMPPRGAGPPPPRENGYYGGPRGGGYRGGGRGGAPPMSDWRRGERPPGPAGGGGGYRGGGSWGGGGRPY